MLKLEIEISELDYLALIQTALPLMQEHLRNSGNPLGMLLSNGMPASMAQRLLANVPQEQIDALVADMINGNSSKMTSKLEQEASKNGVAIKIASLRATSN